MANALPALPCASYTPALPVLPAPKQKRRKKKRRPEASLLAAGAGQQTQAQSQTEEKKVSPPGTLLGHINHNIQTLRQIRRTHMKLSALVAANAADENQGGGGGGSGGGGGERGDTQQTQTQTQTQKKAGAANGGVPGAPKVVVAVEKEREKLLNATGDFCGGRGGELGRRLEAWLYVNGDADGRVDLGRRWEGTEEDEE